MMAWSVKPLAAGESAVASKRECSRERMRMKSTEKVHVPENGEVKSMMFK